MREAGHTGSGVVRGAASGHPFLPLCRPERPSHGRGMGERTLRRARFRLGGGEDPGHRHRARRSPLSIFYYCYYCSSPPPHKSPHRPPPRTQTSPRPAAPPRRLSRAAPLVSGKPAKALGWSMKLSIYPHRPLWTDWLGGEERG